MVHGSGTDVFVVNSGIGGIMPLAAVATDSCGYGWGYSGTGPLNLYRALVYAVSQEVAPVIPYQLYELPQSLVGWITRQPGYNDFLVTCRSSCGRWMLTRQCGRRSSEQEIALARQQPGNSTNQCGRAVGVAESPGSPGICPSQL